MRSKLWWRRLMWWGGMERALLSLLIWSQRAQHLLRESSRQPTSWTNESQELQCVLRVKRTRTASSSTTSWIKAHSTTTTGQQLQTRLILPFRTTHASWRAETTAAARIDSRSPLQPTLTRTRCLLLCKGWTRNRSHWSALAGRTTSARITCCPFKLQPMLSLTRAAYTRPWYSLPRSCPLIISRSRWLLRVIAHLTRIIPPLRWARTATCRFLPARLPALAALLSAEPVGSRWE